MTNPYARCLLKSQDFKYSQLRPTLGLIYTLKLAIKHFNKLSVLNLCGVLLSTHAHSFFNFVFSNVLVHIHSGAHLHTQELTRASTVLQSATEQMGGTTPVWRQHLN